MEYFWGARVSNGGDCTVDVTTTVLNVTQACLEPDSKGSTTLLVQTPRFEEPFPVCTLRAGQVDHCGINQTFYPGDEAVKFSVRGKGVISITGLHSSRAALRPRSLAACSPTRNPTVSRHSGKGHGRGRRRGGRRRRGV